MAAAGRVQLVMNPNSSKMASEFTSFEIRLLTSMVSKYSDEDIAGMLEKPVQDVTAKIQELTGGANPYKEKATIAVMEKLNRLPREKKKTGPKKLPKKTGPKKSAKRQQEEEAKRRRIETRKLAAQRVAERQAVKRQKEVLFKTKTVDYSQLQTVRIDHRTVIYARPGEDPETARKRYLQNRPKR